MGDAFQSLVDFLVGLPVGAVYAVIGGLAAVENVFPPVPADTAIAIGAFLSDAGSISALTVFLITWSSNVASAGAVYLVARRFGRPIFKGKLGQRLLNEQSMARLERAYAQHGVWGIFVSRLVPGVRAVVPPFAGVAGLGFGRAILPLAVASGVWYGLLTFIAARVLTELSQVTAVVNGLNTTGIVLAVVVVGIFGLLLWRSTRNRNNRESV